MSSFCRTNGTIQSNVCIYFTSALHYKVTFGRVFHYSFCPVFFLRPLKCCSVVNTRKWAWWDCVSFLVKYNHIHNKLREINAGYSFLFSIADHCHCTLTIFKCSITLTIAMYNVWTPRLATPNHLRHSYFFLVFFLLGCLSTASVLLCYQEMQA